MLPTPTNSTLTIQDMAQAKYSGNGGKRPKYGDAKLLTTPNARDWKDTPNMAKTRKDGRSKVDQCSRQVGDSTGLMLQAAFAEWMMGYPYRWTDLNCQNPDTEWNVLRDLETPSSRNSHTG
jgi:hypothetical protein